jgi:dTDP-4-dehydrorhamnose 3,5-epimerase
MQVIPTALPGVLMLEPTVFRDERGVFFESFNQRAFDEAVGQHVLFVQDNHSCSKRGVLRGLHYQLPPNAQGKLVRVVRGRAFDVAVDIRRGSPTFGRWLGVTLDAESPRQLWIPTGFAHGFMALDDGTAFLYKTTAFYAKECERSILWSDPDLAIEWPEVGATPLLAPRDAAAPGMAQADLF